MPTLEERLQELERALSVMRSEHILDIKQLSERVDILQQQIIEQQRRVSEQGQSMHQRFDTLERALSQQFAIVNQSLLRLEQQGKQQTDEIKAKFESVDLFAARTWGLAQEQERDIRTMKEDMQGMSGRFDTQDEKLNLILERLPKQ
jgi:exonuclease VII large subunit